MSNLIALKKTANRWEFQIEAALEAFVLANLHSLLGLKHLKQQYLVNTKSAKISSGEFNRFSAQSRSLSTLK